MTDQGRKNGSLWALVLAGGDGTRLSELTRRRYGYARPKQFCALLGPRSMVHEAIARAERLVPRERIVVSTTRRWRPEALQCLAATPGVRLSEQPDNAGTAPGLLLSLLQIQAADPDSRVVILPSDHHIEDLAQFTAVVGATAGDGATPLVLIGAELPQPQQGLGWIRPESPVDPFARIRDFVEKPAPAHTRRLYDEGALANTFTMVGRTRAFVELLAAHLPQWHAACSEALDDERALEQIYRELPDSDFSKDVLQRTDQALHTASLGDVGWSDVGTPERLAAVAGTGPRAADLPPPPARRPSLRPLHD